jgi:hypothetical protein
MPLFWVVMLTCYTYTPPTAVLLLLSPALTSPLPV